MENLPQVLGLLNLPEGKAALVQARVEARLSKETPSAWCREFRDRAARLLTAPVFTPDYGEHYTVLRNLLSGQGIIQYAGQHGILVPDEEIDTTPKRPPQVIIATRPALPAHLRPANKQVVVGAPPVTAPPVVTSAAPSSSVVDPGATPEHRDNISGMYVERADGSWVLECDILRGDQIQISTVMDDGNDTSYEMPLAAHGAQRIELQLPAGRRPVTVVIVVLNGTAEVGRGIIGGSAN